MLYAAPDLESVLCEWLPGMLTSVPGLGGLPVTDKEPANREQLPDGYVVLYRTGTGTPRRRESPRSDRPVVTFDAYAERDTRAQLICAVVLGLLEQAGRDLERIGPVFLYSTRVVGGPVNMPALDPPRPRYRCSVEFHVEKTQIA